MTAEIYKIIKFFDLFDYPLTAYELWQYLHVSATLDEVYKVLTSLDYQIIETSNGFYFLSGRQDIVSERLKRYNYTDRKLKIARQVARYFKIFPGVKMIAVSNFIGAHNLRDGSDIDFLIISSSGRLWTTRLWCTGLAKIFRLRPRNSNKQDKICLSFYISTDFLDLKSLKLSGDDWYFDYWLASLVPIYDSANFFPKLLEFNNWLKEILPNWSEPVINPRQSLSKKHLPELQIGAKFFERLAKSWQLAIMPKALKNPGPEAGVVISDQLLKLFLIDKRREFMAKLNDY